MRARAVPVMRARRVSSVRQVSTWVIVAAGPILYAAVVVLLGLARISTALPLPWWAAQAVPPLLYAAVVRLCIRPLSVLRWMIATLCLSAVHVLLGALTVLALSRAGASSIDLASVDTFLPPALPGLLLVPLLLIPFRDMVVGRPSARSRRETAVRQPRGARHVGVPAPVSSVRRTAVTPGRVLATERPGDGQRPRETREGSRPSPPPRESEAGGIEPRGREAAVVVEDVAEARRSQPNEESAYGSSTTLLRVSFERVANQLPPGAFQVSLDQIGAGLQEPRHLLIPERLVLSQLAAGFVRAPWEVVAEQFPGHALAMRHEEIARHLPDGQLVLPLDELVPQLPMDVFALSGQAIDIERIESVPPPFQPVGDPESAGERSDAMPEVDTGSRPQDCESRITEATPPEAVEPPAGAPARCDAATMGSVLAALAPLGPVNVGVESVDGATLFTVCASGLGGDSLLDAARLLLPLLAEGRVPWPAEQLTMRGAEAALVLTPLDPSRGCEAFLLSTVRREGRLALMERLCLRAASHPGPAVGEPAADREQGDEWPEPELLDSEPPTRVHQTAATLDALGAVTAGMLRDAEAERDLYLFLPAGSDVRMIGRFAGELDHIMHKMAGSSPAFHSAVVRCGRRRLIIHLAPAAAQRPAIVVAGGETSRPGLAYRQVERAALALTAA